MTINNILTAVGVTSATFATLMAQIDPMSDRLGLMGALIALLVLVVRTVNELGKAWLAFEESQLEARKLKERITQLERERDAAQAERASASPAGPAEPAAPFCRYGAPVPLGPGQQPHVEPPKDPSP